MTVALVAAVAANGVIGRDGGLPWHLPADLAHFKRLTVGHVMIMGRRTYESIGRALPGRTTVVVTRTRDWAAEGVIVATSVEAALDVARAIDDTVLVVGGSEVFAAALPVADRMYLTHVDAVPAGDTYFPDVDWSQWVEVGRETGHGLVFVEYARTTRG